MEKRSTTSVSGKKVAKRALLLRWRLAALLTVSGIFFQLNQFLPGAENYMIGYASQLRYLQTLTEIGVEKNTTIVFPLPVDVFSKIEAALVGVANSGGETPPASGGTPPA